jgi:hypothetical protein
MSAADLRSVPDLLGDAFRKASELFSNEAALIRAELSEKTAQAGRGASMIGAGAILMIPALTLILFSVATWTVTRGFEPWLAYLMTGGGAFAIGGIVIVVGMSRLSADNLKPALTIDEIRRDRTAGREMMR